MKNGSKFTLTAIALGAAITLSTLGFAAEEKEKEKPAAEVKVVSGEIVDLMCYLDHGAKGTKHRGCASKCIEGGGPVGLLSGEDLYLLVGDHAPINKDIASKASETVKIKGKVVEKNGMKMIEDAKLTE